MEYSLFQYPEGEEVPSSQGAKGHGLGKNIDVRAEGSQIVVAPSIHANGNRYQWANNLPIAPLPQMWIDRLKKSAPQTVAESPSYASLALMSGLSTVGLRHPYVEKVIQSELANVEAAVKGERNSTIFKAACSIGGWIQDGHLSKDESHALIFQAAERNGYVADDGVAATNAAIESGLQTGMQSPRQVPSTPPGFSNVTEGKRPGLYYKEPPKEEGGESELVWLGPPLTILGMARDDSGHGWGLLLQWKDPDGRSHKWRLPYEMLSGSDPSVWRSELASRGWLGATPKRARDLLARYLNDSQPVNRILVVSETGWHKDAFILPDAAIQSATTIEQIILQDKVIRNPYQSSGSLEEWRNTIGVLTEGNSLLMLVVCAALAAPLMKFAGLDSGGFNFVGSSSTGKTTALLVAASVWGKGSPRDGYVRSWRTTDNALESIAALHSDALLCLDELSQAPAHVVSAAAYMLGNGQGKARSTRKGNARLIKNWRTMILSTGEQGLESKLHEAGLRHNAGQAVRLIDIPADAGAGLGLFENTHGASPQSFADQLRHFASIHYGHTAHAFVQKVVDQPEYVKDLPDTVARISTSLAGPNAEGQVQRVSKRFALCLIAGELATAWNLLPWQQGAANTAIRKVFASHLEYRGGEGATEKMQLLKQVRRFIEQHGNSRFQLMEKEFLTDSGGYYNRVGFRVTEGVQNFYYVLPECFAHELCKGFDVKYAVNVLRGEGMLCSKESNRVMTKLPKDVPGLGRPRCYALVLESE